MAVYYCDILSSMVVWDFGCSWCLNPPRAYRNRHAFWQGYWPRREHPQEPVSIKYLKITFGSFLLIQLKYNKYVIFGVHYISRARILNKRFTRQVLLENERMMRCSTKVFSSHITNHCSMWFIRLVPPLFFCYPYSMLISYVGWCWMEWP